MDINQFQEKLKDIQTLAMQNGKKVHTELVEQFFDEPGMDKDKLQKVYDFLEVQGIYVEGYSKSRSKEAEADVPAEILALTPEEEAFLEEYLEGFVLPGQAEKEAVLKALKAGGDYEAEELLRCLQGFDSGGKGIELSGNLFRRLAAGGQHGASYGCQKRRRTGKSCRVASGRGQKYHAPFY